MKSVTDEWWIKMRNNTWWIIEQLGEVDIYTLVEWEYVITYALDYLKGIIHFKTTEHIVGFFVYVAQTYTSMVLYLKGIYLALNSWRQGQDEDEWIIPKLQGDAANLLDEQLPNIVKFVTQLKYNIVALMEFTTKDDPPDVPDQVINSVVIYLVGDALG